MVLLVGSDVSTNFVFLLVPGLLSDFETAIPIRDDGSGTPNCSCHSYFCIFNEVIQPFRTEPRDVRDRRHQDRSEGEGFLRQAGGDGLGHLLVRPCTMRV